MESYCVHYPLSPSLASSLTPLLRAGDDAKEVGWVDLGSVDHASWQPSADTYPCHRNILKMLKEKWKQNKTNSSTTGKQKL